MLRGQLVTIPATPLAVATIRTYGTGLFLYGSVVMAQDPDRWGGPSYATIRAIAPPDVWGAVIGCLGLLILVGSFTALFAVRNVGIYGAALWLAVLGLAVLNAAANDPHVSLTGPILNGTLATAMCLVARAREVRPDAGLTSSA